MSTSEQELTTPPTPIPEVTHLDTGESASSQASDAADEELGQIQMTEAQPATGGVLLGDGEAADEECAAAPADEKATQAETVSTDGDGAHACDERACYYDDNYDQSSDDDCSWCCFKVCTACCFIGLIAGGIALMVAFIPRWCSTIRVKNEISNATIQFLNGECVVRYGGNTYEHAQCRNVSTGDYRKLNAHSVMDPDLGYSEAHFKVFRNNRNGKALATVDVRKPYDIRKHGEYDPVVEMSSHVSASVWDIVVEYTSECTLTFTNGAATQAAAATRVAQGFDTLTTPLQYMATSAVGYFGQMQMALSVLTSHVAEQLTFSNVASSIGQFFWHAPGNVVRNSAMLAQAGANVGHAMLRGARI